MNLRHSTRFTRHLLAWTSLGALAMACSSEPEIYTGIDGDGDSGKAADGSSTSDTLDLGDGDSGNGTDGGNGTGTGANTGTGQGGSAVVAPPWEFPDDITFDYTPISNDGEFCASTPGTPKSISRPIDIIFVIDNSSSMRPVIQEVERSIHSDFSKIIEAADPPIDYQVIIISRYGAPAGPDVGESDFRICIPSPLGGHACTDPDGDLAISDGTEIPSKSAKFKHYSMDIESRDAFCAMLESYDVADEFDDDALGRTGWTTQANNGWQEWLRIDAFKTFVVITDDDSACRTDKFFGDSDPEQNFDLNLNDQNTVAGGETVGAAVDAAILSLPGSHFGTAMSRNYIWHSIVGIKKFNANNDPWPPTEDIQLDNRCEVETGNTADGRGTGYQELSKITGGLRYPVCPDDPSDTSTVNFDPIFNEIAQGVIETAAIPCEFDFPTVAGIINPDNIKVNYTPTGGGAVQEFNRVNNLAACTAGDDFYFDNNTTPTKLFLCGGACTTVQDDGGDLQLDFGCLGN